MTEIPNQSNEQPQELDDFDVEGHGLKEVAIGLSAATIVAGGAGAASLALDNPLPGTTSGVQAAVAGVHGDVDDRLTWTQGVAAGPLTMAAGAVADAQQAVDSAGSFAISTAATTATPLVDRATGTIADTTQLAGDVIADPIGTSDRVVDQTVQTVRETRDGALATARSTVATAVTTAEGAADTAVDTADGAATSTISLTTSTVDAAYSTVDPSAEISTDDGASASVSAAGKSVHVDVS